MEYMEEPQCLYYQRRQTTEGRGLTHFGVQKTAILPVLATRGPVLLLYPTN